MTADAWQTAWRTAQAAATVNYFSGIMEPVSMKRVWKLNAS